MKRIVFLIMMFAGAMLLLNSPPKNDQPSTEGTVISTEISESFAFIQAPALPAYNTPIILPWLGGLELQTDISSWSATIDNALPIIAVQNDGNSSYMNLNLCMLHNDRPSDGSRIQMTGTRLCKKGLTRLDIGEHYKCWYIQST